MKKIYVLLMHTHTVPARVIKTFTNATYSHVAISLDKSCEVVYSFGRTNPFSILHGGFTAEHKNGVFFNKFNKTKCKIYEIKVSDKQYIHIKSILSNMLEHKEIYKYDYLGIVPRFLGIPISKKNRYVCSHFIASLLERTDVYKFDKKTCMIIPKDFEKINCFKEIYNGSYKSYSEIAC